LDARPDPLIVFFDTEISKLDTEVGGWANVLQGHAGLSAAVTVSAPTPRVGLFDLHTVENLVNYLEDADVVVSFNGRGFDVPLLSSLVGRPLVLPRHLDLCDLISRSVGKPKHGAWGLDAICRRTLGYGKTGSGEFAPALAQAGRFGELFDYCLNDVYILQDLFEHIRLKGFVVGTQGEEILLPKVQEAINAVC